MLDARVCAHLCAHACGPDDSGGPLGSRARAGRAVLPGANSPRTDSEVRTAVLTYRAHSGEIAARSRVNRPPAHPRS